MNYTFDLDTITKDIKLRNGVTRHVEIKELTEDQSRWRQNLVIDPVQNRGRGRGGNTNIRLDRQRKFDFKACVADWDLKYSDLKKGVSPEEDHVLPLDDSVFSKLPSYISNQIADAISDVNSEPEEDMPESESENGSDPYADEAEHEGSPVESVENPT